VIVIAVTGWALEALAMCGVAYTLAAAVVSARFLRRELRQGGPTPDVTIIKPLHGAPNYLRETLEAFCLQDYPGAIQLVFGVQHPDDPAIPVVEDLIADHPLVDITLVINTAMHGVNRKASNLININARAKHGVLVLSDADIVVEQDYLRQVAAALSAPDVGAVSLLYVGMDELTMWSRLSAMLIDYQFLPSAVLGKALGMADPCFGSTIALSAVTLERIGGFAAFADHLADDYEIGRAVRALGLRVEMPPMVVRHHSPVTSVRELVSHEFRWARTVRQIDAAGHAGSIVTHPLPLALIGAVLLGFSTFSTIILSTAFVARLCSKSLIERATGTRAGPWWLIPLRDVLSFYVFVASFFIDTVRWQGRQFRIGYGGVIHHH